FGRHAAGWLGAVAAARAFFAGVDRALLAHEVTFGITAAAGAVLVAAPRGAGADAFADACADARAEAEGAALDLVAFDAGELAQARRQIAIDDVVEDLAVLVFEQRDLRRFRRHVARVRIARTLDFAFTAGLAFVVLRRGVLRLLGGLGRARALTFLLDRRGR